MPRHVFGGEKLARDAARLLDHDRASPPESRPSLMDVVRAFSDYIETRARLGWTDPMIAALLTEAGYPITAATLRSYRKRLRDARSTTVHAQGTDPPAPMPARTVVAARPVVPEPSPPVSKAMAVPAPPPPSPSASAKPTSSGDSPKSRTFSVRGASMPPDRA